MRTSTGTIIKKGGLLACCCRVCRPRRQEETRQKAQAHNDGPLFDPLNPQTQVAGRAQPRRGRGGGRAARTRAMAPQLHPQRPH